MTAALDVTSVPWNQLLTTQDSETSKIRLKSETEDSPEDSPRLKSGRG
jgi:hypothetical protein